MRIDGANGVQSCRPHLSIPIADELGDLRQCFGNGESMCAVLREQSTEFFGAFCSNSGVLGYKAVLEDRIEDF